MCISVQMLTFKKTKNHLLLEEKYEIFTVCANKLQAADSATPFDDSG